MPESAAICDFPPKKRALLHEILERIADKWTLLVIEALDGEGEMRFSDLQRRIGQISHKMLTKTLRQLDVTASSGAACTRRCRHASTTSSRHWEKVCVNHCAASGRGWDSTCPRSSAPGVLMTETESARMDAFQGQERTLARCSWPGR
jgi:HxlR-like helix-turn-helix